MITLSVDSREAGLVLKKIGDSVPPALAKSVLKAANHAGGVIAKNVVAMFPGGTGQMARSFLPAKFIATQGFGSVAAGALSDLDHARIQDEGGIIRPKTAKLLAIPQTPKAQKRWPRDWPKDALLFIRSKAGKMSLWETKYRTRAIPGQKRVKGQKSERESFAHSSVLQYLLVPWVKIIGKHYLDKSADEAKEKIAEILHDEVKRTVEGGKNA